MDRPKITVPLIFCIRKKEPTCNLMNSEKYIKRKAFVDAESSEIFKRSEQQVHDMRTMINSGLMILFWEIGQTINQYLAVNKNETDKRSAILAVSKVLASSYGAFFDAKNLERMLAFAELSPKFLFVKQISSFISWEHIVHLVTLKESKVFAHYTKLTIEKGLSVYELLQKLREHTLAGLNLIQNTKKTVGAEKGFFSFNGVNGDVFLQPLRPKQYRDIALSPQLRRNYFDPLLLSSFHKMTGFSKHSARHIRQAFNVENYGQLFVLIFEHFENYRRQQNSWVTANLNLFFWEIGRLINQHTSLYDDIKKKHFLRETALKLKTRYSASFTEKQLRKMADFAKQIPNRHIATRIAFLVQWGYIFYLLELPEIEKILFYARIAGKQGLSISQLRKEVSNGLFEYIGGAKDCEKDFILELQKVTTKLEEQNQVNETIAIVTNFIDLGEDIHSSLATESVFKNSFFLDFMKRF